MSPRPLALFGLLAILLAASFAAAQVPSPTVPPITAPPGTVPGVPTAPSTVLDVEENGLTFQGPAGNPNYVAVEGPDGAKAFEYELDAFGRASLRVAGEQPVADATLLFIEGDPLGERFTLVLSDAQGGRHDVLVDRAVLQTNVDLPPEVQLPPIAITRPFDWPGAPARSYMLFIEDAARNHLGVAALDGSSFLQKEGTHRVILQIPHAENAWDRWTMTARIAGATEGIHVPFEILTSTDTASVLAASFLAGNLRAAEGDTIEIDIVYEKRITPLVANRFADPLRPSYRVDGTGPTVKLHAPESADSFKFEVSWEGTDALSGIGGFTIDYKPTSARLWNRWLDKSSDTSAIFSGDWGQTYEFRARSLDAVGNPSQEVTALTVIVAKPSDDADINDAPTARLLAPQPGALAGATTIRWEASDPDGTPVSSKVEVSDDEGLTWRLLYTGQLKSVPWDTTMEQDGSGYRIRLTVSDGTLTAADAISGITIRNVVAPPAAPVTSTPPQTSPSAPPTTGGTQTGDANDRDQATPASTDEKNGIPMPFVGLALAGAALLARRRVRG